MDIATHLNSAALIRESPRFPPDQVALVTAALSPYEYRGHPILRLRLLPSRPFLMTSLQSPDPNDVKSVSAGACGDVVVSCLQVTSLALIPLRPLVEIASLSLSIQSSSQQGISGGLARVELLSRLFLCRIMKFELRKRWGKSRDPCI